MIISFHFQPSLYDFSPAQETLDVATEPWGVRVERVEVKDVRVPEQLMRAMAAEAEAAREARAKVIAAEGEHKASRALRHAAEVITDCPAALQVWNMQTVLTFSDTRKLSAEISSNFEQHLGRAQQHDHLPGPYRPCVKLFIFTAAAISELTAKIKSHFLFTPSNLSSG